MMRFFFLIHFKYSLLLISSLGGDPPGPLLRLRNSIKILIYYFLLWGETPQAPLLRLRNNVKILFS
jgi:hypothetical protein